MCIWAIPQIQPLQCPNSKDEQWDCLVQAENCREENIEGIDVLHVRGLEEQFLPFHPLGSCQFGKNQVYL